MTTSDERTTDRIIRGVLHFPGVEPGWADRITAQVLDVGRADAPAVVLAETVLGQCHLADGMVVEVAVPTEAASRPGAKILQVQVDVSDADDEESGDYFTTQAHPVLLPGQDDTVDVSLMSI